MTITCSTSARSYLYDDLVPQLLSLQQLQFIDCKFHDIPKDAFRGLSQLEIMVIDRANLLGHIDPQFAAHLPRLMRLHIINSRVTFLPPLCASQNLKTLNVSFNNIADLDHAGINCPSRPLSMLEILDFGFNRISAMPTWLGDSMPTLISLSSDHNSVSEVDDTLCRKLPSLRFLDLSFNKLHAPARVRLSNCTQLRILGLRSNPMGSLPAGVLGGMPHVQNLYLPDMGLTDSVWDKLFRLQHLEVLELQENALTTVQPAVLRDLPNLQRLNISGNVIRALPTKSFSNLFRLEVLDLSSNGLAYLPLMIFSSLTSLRELYLRNNSIDDVDITSFSGLRSLRTLDFSNNLIRFIPEQALSTLGSLTVLDLSGNRLRALSDSAFVRMVSLDRVRLARNGLTSIPSMSGLLSLAEVDLGNNNLTSLPDTMFTGLVNLTKVVLKNNGLRSLPMKTFQDCRNLKYLDLSGNKLVSLSPTNFYNVGNLEYLDLSENEIAALGTALHQLRIRTLLLRGNQLQKLYRNDVSSTMEVLDLSHNQISYIFPFAFNVAVANLRIVNLTFNELTTISSNPMEISITQIYSPPVFYLRGNPVRCDCELGWLKDWSLGRIPGNVEPLPQFGDLDQLQCYTTFVGSNRTAGDLTLINAHREEFLCPYSRKCAPECVCCGFDSCHCNSVCPTGCTCFIGDSRLLLNRVSCANANLDFLPAGVPEKATELYLDGNNFGVLNSLAFIGQGQVTLLRLNNSDIHHLENLTFRGMLSLRELHLENNAISLLYKNIFMDLENLEELYLQDNELSFVEEGSFAAMKKLHTLNLERNLLITISLNDFSGISSLTSLRLKDNLWMCGPNFTCALMQFVANSSVVKDLKSILCYDLDGNSSPKAVGAMVYGKAAGGLEESIKVNGTPVLSLPLHQCGVDSNLTDLFFNATQPSTHNMAAFPPHQLPLLIAVSVASVLVISTLILIYVNRHLLEVWCFTKFGWRLHKMTPRRGSPRARNGEGGAIVADEETDRPYDAFVSYSSLDEDFVVQELAPRLENGHKRFRLCLHYRDFPVGASIAETIVRSVESSKRTILLVSNNFLDSEWCKFEFQTAHQQVLSEKRNRVILILMPDLDDQKLDNTLKLYTRTRTYLRIDDPWFWEKLFFAMPDKKVEKFERLPSTRDLEYVARFGRSPSKTPCCLHGPASTPSSVRAGELSRNGNTPLRAGGIDPRIDAMLREDAQWDAMLRGNGHVNTALAGDALLTLVRGGDSYEVPVASNATYEGVNESLSVGSSLYNGGSFGQGSGHYEEVLPIGSHYVMQQHVNDNCSACMMHAHSRLPPPLPPIPVTGLLSQEEVRNSPRHLPSSAVASVGGSGSASGSFTSSRDENWV